MTDLLGNGARLRIRHQTFRTELTTQRTNLTHRRRRGNQDVKVHPSAFDLRNDIVEPDEIRACVDRLLLQCLVICDDRNDNLLACPFRQRNRSTDRLIRLLRVHSKLERQLHRLIKLHRRHLFECLQRVNQGVHCLFVVLGNLRFVEFASLSHRSPQLPYCEQCRR